MMPARRMVGEDRLSMRLALAVWLVSTLIGGVIVALPDDGQPLVSFSDAHGPSLLDAAGIALAVGGWLVFITAFYRRRSSFQSRLSSSRRMIVASFIIGLGAGLILASVVNDFTGWWVIGAAMLVCVQLWLARLVM